MAAAAREEGRKPRELVSKQEQSALPSTSATEVEVEVEVEAETELEAEASEVGLRRSLENCVCFTTGRVPLVDISERSRI